MSPETKRDGQKSKVIIIEAFDSDTGIRRPEHDLVYDEDTGQSLEEVNFQEGEKPSLFPANNSSKIKQ